MSERISYNQEYQPPSTHFEDGAEIDLRASQLGSVEEGRLQAEATRLAESAAPERATPVDAHMEQVNYVAAIGKHTMALRQRELASMEMSH